MEWFAVAKTHGVNALYAASILIVGFLLSSFLKRWVRMRVRKKSKDPTVKLFVANIVYAVCLMIVLTSALGRLGVPTGSLITILGAAGLAIALSLKNSLSNVANGFVIIAMKFFHIGDLVEINGVLGKVYQVNLFNTKVVTFNNDLVIIPNSKVVENNVYVRGVKGIRRIDMAIGISYESSISDAKNIVTEILKSHDKVLSDPAPMVAVKELADSSVVLVIRPWVNRTEYSGVLYDLTEKIKLAFDQADIVIPYPQVQAHLSSVGLQGGVS